MNLGVPTGAAIGVLGTIFSSSSLPSLVVSFCRQSCHVRHHSLCAKGMQEGFLQKQRTETKEDPPCRSQRAGKVSCTPSSVGTDRTETGRSPSEDVPGPGGTFDNSPTFQRWVQWPEIVSPEGTAEKSTPTGKNSISG